MRPPLTLLLALAVAAFGCSPAASDRSVAPSPSGSPAGSVSPSPADEGADTATLEVLTPLPEPVPRTTAPSPPVAEAEPPAPPAELVGLLSQLRRFPQTITSGRTTVSILDDAGQPVLAYHSRRPLLPASTMKLVTAAAALELLGPDYRFVTKVYATRPPRADGTLEGNLVVVGSGDPVLSTRTYATRVAAERPHTSLGVLARRIVESGITRIDGRVVGDGSWFADEPMASGWRADYLTSLNTSPASGLTVDGGLRLFNRNGILHAEAAGDPAQRTAAVLHELLADRGVRPSKPPIALRDARPATTQIAEVRSPPLWRLLRYALQRSDNHLADGIFRTLGAVREDATWDGSGRAVRRILAHHGLDWTGIRIADGSGLSRNNRLTARFLSDLTRVMATGEQRGLWLELQAVSGRSGSLRNRLRGSLADARLYGKTGTLRDVRSFAGTVLGPDDHAYHVAILGNGIASWDDVAAVRRLTDVLVLALAADLHGCDRPVAVPDEPEAVPEALLCGGS